MKKLAVPLILQRIFSLDCGPTCVQMILEYFGIKKNFKELKSQLDYNSVGTSAFDNGLLLLNEGLRVVAVTAQPLLFAPDLKLKTQEDIAKLVKNKKFKKNKFQSGLKNLNKYLDWGGKLRVEIPSFKHIKKAIDQGSPVLALIHSNALGGKEGGGYHFVIVTGYKNNQVFLNNPSPFSTKQAWFPVDRFLYALHSSTTADIDNGTLIVVSK